MFFFVGGGVWVARRDVAGSSNSVSAAQCSWSGCWIRWLAEWLVAAAARDLAAPVGREVAG